jgi:hypothetical protein
MRKSILHVFGAASIVAVLGVSSAVAQQPQGVRVRGTIERVEGATLFVKSRTGETLRVKLVDTTRVSRAVKVPLSDVKLNSYVAITAMPQPDGMQRATEVMIFPEAARGTGEGHGPWDSRPQSTMTNATVTETVSGVNGQVLTVKYKGSEKKFVVPADAAIITPKPASKDDLKPGEKIFIFNAPKEADGTLRGTNITIGRDG